MSNEKALLAYIAKRREVEMLLARISERISSSDFDSYPDEFHWGRVGDMTLIATMLQEISDHLSNEGEYRP